MAREPERKEAPEGDPRGLSGGSGESRTPKRLSAPALFERVYRTSGSASAVSLARYFGAGTASGYSSRARRQGQAGSWSVSVSDSPVISGHSRQPFHSESRGGSCAARSRTICSALSMPSVYHAASGEPWWDSNPHPLREHGLSVTPEVVPTLRFELRHSPLLRRLPLPLG